MIYTKCTTRFKDSKGNYVYRVADFEGNLQNFRAKELRQAIKDGKIVVVNLSLTSDDRLVEKKIETLK